MANKYADVFSPQYTHTDAHFLLPTKIQNTKNVRTALPKHEKTFGSKQGL